jgi:MFS family permease
MSRSARTGLVVLTLINLFNYLDRWIVAALAESMKHSELQLSDAQLGSLMTGFLIVYMLAAPLFGALGDTRSRTRLLSIGVGLWSIATALAGLARNYAGLFAARAAVGIGEAAYGTISPALLADYYPRERRGRVFAVFFAAIPIGSALGYIVGGLADHYFGWRQAFFIAGVPGLVLAVLALRLHDPPRGSQDPEEAPPPVIRRAYRRFWSGRGAFPRRRRRYSSERSSWSRASSELTSAGGSATGCCVSRARRISGSRVWSL